MEKRIAIIGGDARQLRAAFRLREAGYETLLYGFGGYPVDEAGPVDSLCCSACSRVPPGISDQLAAAGKITDSPETALDGCGAVLLPLPVSADGVNISMPLGRGGSLTFDELCRMMAERGIGLLCGGRLSDRMHGICAGRNIEAFDYYECEEFAIANAIPTAEGAIEIAMHELPITLHASKALVIGFGRIGKVLARYLKALGAEVTVSARKASDQAWIRAEGFSAAHTGELCRLFDACGFDVIFNTVPHAVLGTAELGRISPETLIIDLASKPGGIAGEALGRFPHSVIWALSLPGKVAPVTSGNIIAETVLGAIERR